MEGPEKGLGEEGRTGGGWALRDAQVSKAGRLWGCWDFGIKTGDREWILKVLTTRKRNSNYVR